MRVNDLVEDREGDKAVVRELYEDGYVGIEWNSTDRAPRARVHESRLTNISEVVRELDAEHPRYWPPDVSLSYECPECGAEVDIREARSL